MQASRDTLPKARSDGLTVYLLVPLAGLLFALVLQPLLLRGCDFSDTACLTASRVENKIFWPLLAATALVMVFVNWSRVSVPRRAAMPLICLAAFVGWAGASVLWAFRPEISAIRYIQQVAVVTCMVLPALIITGRGDVLRMLFLAFALGCVINVWFVMGPPPTFAENATPGHTGYFAGKNYLGLFAAVALMLSVNEMLNGGTRAMSGAVIAAIACALLVMSNAKTAFALAALAPMLAGVCVLGRRLFRIPILTLPFLILASYAVVSLLGIFNIYRLSSLIYGDATFTGRSIIWQFAGYEIAQRPWFGWGYQSFWLVGPDAPSVVDAPGWVKSMPNAHNGYVDTTLEMGYVGLCLLVAFVATTLHAAQRIVDRSAARGWIVLSLMVFIATINGLESQWMRGFEFIWLVFLALVSETVRSEALANLAPKVAPTPSYQRVSPSRSRYSRRNPGSPRSGSAAPPSSRRKH